MESFVRPSTDAGGPGPGAAASPDRAFQVDFREVTLAGSVYFIPAYAMRRPACQMFLNGKVYEPLTHLLVAEILKHHPGDMVHAGTFFGDMLPAFSAACPGTVYAFEPVLENYVLAKLCVERNGLGNVLLWNAGLGDRLSVARIETATPSGAHHGGGSHIAEAASAAQSGQTTSVVPIDMLGLDEVALIQLDVEGFELNALRGAGATIARCRPIVLAEDNAKSCAPLLQAAGYAFAGRIPGLDAWAPADKVDALAASVRALTEARPQGR
ncbi:FkbM family methyltransferase [Rhizobium sp. TRM95111]|uniref:FkbM family methyltransferase n=1 Tax=Rhizobium alarense TaxID=2846851 RepID=UPI001EFFF066|nr:FkbM family methyltransferase [Rhizobium alarense]MCF3642737.1 FkbM family methyltransferase [Rhizobium alarense]